MIIKWQPTIAKALAQLKRIEKQKRCIACNQLNCKKTDGWNFRVVAEYQEKYKTWIFSIREVYYKKCKIEGWTANPSDLVTDVDTNDLYAEIQSIQGAFTKPLLVEQGEKLIPHGGISAGVKPEQLTQYLTPPQ